MIRYHNLLSWSTCYRRNHHMAILTWCSLQNKLACISVDVLNSSLCLTPYSWWSSSLDKGYLQWSNTVSCPRCRRSYLAKIHAPDGCGKTKCKGDGGSPRQWESNRSLRLWILRLLVYHFPLNGVWSGGQNSRKQDIVVARALYASSSCLLIFA